jgi:MerR family copper efflux transcriptional regulator
LALARCHCRYSREDVDAIQMLACLHPMRMGIEDMRTYQANRARGRAAAAEQRDLLLCHAERVEAQRLPRTWSAISANGSPLPR